MHGERAMCVDKKLIEELTAFLKKYDRIEKVVLFGSRARGDNTERSDYDIAIYGSLSGIEKAAVRSFIDEDLKTLHNFDVVFISDKTNPELIKNIEKDGIDLYG